MLRTLVHTGFVKTLYAPDSVHVEDIDLELYPAQEAARKPNRYLINAINSDYLLTSKFAFAARVPFERHPLPPSELPELSNPEYQSILAKWHIVRPPSASSEELGDPEYHNMLKVTSQWSIPLDVSRVHELRRDYLAGTLVHNEDTLKRPGFRVYLGDAADAVDYMWLHSKGIGAVLNMIDMSHGFMPLQLENFARFISDYHVLLQPAKNLEKWYQRKLDDRNAMYLIIPTEDTADQRLIDVFSEAVTFINRARSAGTNILVHCYAGQNRSAAIVVAWLISNDAKLSLRDAVLQVNRARSAPPDFVILENPTFRQDLILYCTQKLLRPEEQCRLPVRDRALGWKS